VRRVRAWRCRKVRGRAYCGYCAAKKEPFFGWRLHLVCTTGGVPVAYALLPASQHDLTPIHELLYRLPAEAMGLQRLRARTNAGFDLKVHASVLALACTNMN